MNQTSGPSHGGPASQVRAEAAPAVTAGDRAPDFRLTDQHGQTVTLQEYVGVKAVLVLFFPYAFSRVCGSELRLIQKDIADFQNDRVQVLAISCDALFSQRAYADDEGFTFPLLADHWPHGAAARAYGVFDDARGCAGRGTFLIDPEGTVRWTAHSGIADARDIGAHRAAVAGLTGGGPAAGAAGPAAATLGP